MKKNRNTKPTKAPETSQKPPKRAGRNGNVPPDAPKPFSKENQPSAEAKRKGWAKKRVGRDLAKAILELGFHGGLESKMADSISEYFGVEKSELTIEMVALFRQAQKAIQKADTFAFNAIMDRAHGRPTQPLSADDGAIKITVKGAKKS